MERQHIVAIPFPLQGHIAPMLHLLHSLLTRSSNLLVSFVTFESHARELKRSQQQSWFGRGIPHSSELRFVGVPDDPCQKKQGEWISSDDKWLGSMDACYAAFFANFKTAAHLEALLGSQDERPTCLLSDTTSLWVRSMADKFGLTWVGLWTSSAAYLAVNLAISKLVATGFLPPQTGTCVPAGIISGINRDLQAADLPPRSQQDFEYENVINVMNTLKTAPILLVNTCEALEPGLVEVLTKDYFTSGALFQVGPLLGVPLSPEMADVGLWDQDSTCLSWLDSQAERSVVYLSFGSLSDFDFSEVSELALGLKKSGHAFLWVLRQQLVRNDCPEFWKDFGADTREQGRIVSWSPQASVLLHKSVGAFVTHCGWNSIMEAVLAGVPMLAVPRFADQGLNAHTVCYECKIGKRLLSPLNKAAVEQGVKILLESDEGKDMRAKTLELRHALHASSSQRDMSIDALLKAL